MLSSLCRESMGAPSLLWLHLLFQSFLRGPEHVGFDLSSFSGQIVHHHRYMWYQFNKMIINEKLIYNKFSFQVFTQTFTFTSSAFTNSWATLDNS